jgi:hypothetical protein
MEFIKIYRFIPLLLFIFCIIFGTIVLSGKIPDDFIAGHVVISLGAVVFCIFCTASIITKLYLDNFNKFDKYFYPFLSFLTAIITVSFGFWLILNESSDYVFIAGHKVLGLGLICTCLATESVIMTHFRNIQLNSKLKESAIGKRSFSKKSTFILYMIPLSATIFAWSFAGYLLMTSYINDHFIAGHVMAGMAMICTSVFAMVINGIEQANNNYKPIYKTILPTIGFLMGSLALVWGIALIIIDQNPSTYLTPGFILIGISFICFSIFCKLFVVSRLWRFIKLPAQIITIIPLILSMGCILISIMLFPVSSCDMNVFIPARVLLGISTVCASLFAVLSIIYYISKHNK